MDVVKPQPSLRGVTAWMFMKLVQKRGVTQAELAAWVIERWFDEHRDWLAELGITQEQFELETSIREGQPSAEKEPAQVEHGPGLIEGLLQRQNGEANRVESSVPAKLQELLNLYAEVVLAASEGGES